MLRIALAILVAAPLLAGCMVIAADDHPHPHDRQHGSEHHED